MRVQLIGSSGHRAALLLQPGRHSFANGGRWPSPLERRPPVAVGPRHPVDPHREPGRLDEVVPVVVAGPGLEVGVAQPQQLGAPVLEPGEVGDHPQADEQRAERVPDHGVAPVEDPQRPARLRPARTRCGRAGRRAAGSARCRGESSRAQSSAYSGAYSRAATSSSSVEPVRLADHQQLAARRAARRGSPATRPARPRGRRRRAARRRTAREPVAAARTRRASAPTRRGRCALPRRRAASGRRRAAAASRGRRRARSGRGRARRSAAAAPRRGGPRGACRARSP